VSATILSLTRRKLGQTQVISGITLYVEGQPDPKPLPRFERWTSMSGITAVDRADRE